jgi:outer membrane receptor protein involved in Fe transport
MVRIAVRKLRSILVVFACLNALVLLMVAGAPSAHAQGNRVEGGVRDASGASVPHAQVELRAQSYSATTSTGPAGTFIFENVPEASGTLRVTAKDLKPVEKTWSAAAGAPAHVEIVLEPLPLAQRIIVTAARTETRLSDSPVSMIQLTRDDLQATPSLTLDDALRQIPGFGFFRRTSGRTAALGTHSVSLRGLGATAAGRTLVLEDGIPLNDPFSSSDYWDRVPAESVASVEVAQEGASSLYGSDALGGVVQFRTRSAHPGGISLESSYGNQNTPDLSLWAGGQAGRWESTFGGEVFQTDGYILVPEPFRGSVDTAARSKHGTADLMIGRKIGAESKIFARGWFFDDSRHNGTPDTTNDIRLGQGALGANLQLGGIGALTLRFYGEAQTWHQGFSSVLAGRNSEKLTDRQTSPAQGVGGSAVWSRSLGRRQTLVAGFDEHEEIGRSNDILFSSVTGNHTRNTFAGGHQRTVGFFGEDLIQIAPRWILSVSARFDRWRNFDASSQCVPFALSCPPPALTVYADRSYNAFSPRVSLLHQMNSHVSWSGSVYRAFRAPTLNELYRSFRQGNTQTNANSYLSAERLTGGEAGVNVNGFNRRLEVRGVVFFNEIINPVANVTCQQPPLPNLVPPCPSPIPNTILRVRRNLGRTSAPGVEIDATARLTNRIQFSGGYQYVNATVIASPGQTPSLVGRWIAQVPHNVLTFQARYTNPSRINLSVTGRLGGRQFDDDLNNYLLGRYFVLDVMASRQIRGGAEFFVAVENLLNAQYATAATPVPQLGLPIAARFGVRFQFPER